MSNTHSTTSTQNSYRPGDHVVSLDGVRGLAILFVLYHHCVMHFPIRTGIDKVLQRIADATWCGVDLFFVLSGFLITGILINAKGKEGYFRNFLARRALRIFPIYFLTVFTLLVICPYVFAEHLPEAVSGWNQLWYWSYLANFHYVMAPHGTDFFNTVHFWSLCIEEQFYLVWPFVVLFASRDRLAQICKALVIGSILLRVFGWTFGWSQTAMYMLTPMRLDGLAAGSLLAIIAQREAFAAKYKSRMIALFAVSLAILGIIFVFQKGLFNRTPLVLSLGTAGLTGFATALVFFLICNKNSQTSRIMSNRVFLFFGRYSYALYLLHPFVIEWINTWWSDSYLPAVAGSYVLGRLAYTALVLAFSVGVAMISWRLIEKPCLSFKKYFVTGNAKQFKATSTEGVVAGILKNSPKPSGG